MDKTARLIGTLLFNCTMLLSCLVSGARADWLGDLQGPFSAALSSGNWSLALGLSFLAGLATALTPCVYPMIAITVSVFGAHKASSLGRGALLSSAFVLGIAALFTPLGLFAAATGGLFGSALSSPWVLAFLSGLFFALAASMFGVFDLDLPSGLKTRLAQAGGVGVQGAFVLGLCSGLIAAPCTGPVLGFLLTWVGTTGQLFFGALNLFVYSLGLGSLFWVVGTFAVSLPKSGVWLEWIKSLFGIVMVVAAVYVVRDYVPGLSRLFVRDLLVLTISVVAVIGGIAVGAIHLSFHDPGASARLRKGLGIALTWFGLTGTIGYLQGLPPGAKIVWRDDFVSAKASALKNQRPLLIDFTASWCGACHELDRLTFSDPAVVREAERFVSVRIDLSPGRDTPDKKAVLQNYAQYGLPFVVLHTGGGREASRITSFVKPSELLAIMREIR
jgi:thiol:disulfide interchange protein DsbD